MIGPGASYKPNTDKNLQMNLSWNNSGQLPRSLRIREKEEKRRRKEWEKLPLRMKIKIKLLTFLKKCGMINT